MDILELNQYKIYIGPISRSLAECPVDRYSQLLILVDENTERHCLPRLQKLLPKLPPPVIIRIPAGEIHKNLDTCRQIWEQMMDARTDRRALMINLGGGVIGDMGGFCACTFKRGIDFLQIPTTLLSQVDASIGGKLGIDFGMVKNSIGLFHDPKAVFIDPAFLDTLPPREIRSGMAEVFKHALIADAGQWNRISRPDADARVDWAAVIGASLRIKQRIVEADPWERGLRKALNFGHTIGHAVEGMALEGPSPLLHGEAVAIGMICESFLSHRRLGLPMKDVDAIRTTFLRYYGHRPVDTDQWESLLGLMSNDKKNEEGRINFSLLPAIGRVEINGTATPEEIAESIAYYNSL